MVERYRYNKIGIPEPCKYWVVDIVKDDKLHVAFYDPGSNNGPSVSNNMDDIIRDYHSRFLKEKFADIRWFEISGSNPKVFEEIAEYRIDHPGHPWCVLLESALSSAIKAAFQPLLAEGREKRFKRPDVT